MELQITGKNIDIGDALRSHIDERLKQNVGRYFDDTARGNVVMMREGADFRIDCSVHLSSGMMLQATGQSGDAYVGFDMAADRLEKRLRRYKRRLKDHHGRNVLPAASIAAANYVINMHDLEQGAREEYSPPIIAENTTLVRELTVGEAVMQLDITDAAFLFFRNAGHGGLNVVYRRDDGNLGWIDPGEEADKNTQ